MRPPPPPAVPSWPAEGHVCADCGLSYRDLSPAQAIDVVRGVPDSVRAALTTVPPALLRQRPASGGWSITEYLCHLRDVYATYTIRVHRARFEHRPVLEPMLNDLRAQRFGYNERNPDCITDELTANAAGFREEAERVRPQDLDREVTRQPREHRTLRWLLRQAAHEGRHHVRDLENLARQQH